MKFIKNALIAIVAIFTIIIATFWKNDLPLDFLKEKYANTESEFIAIDGMSVHLRDEGNPTDSIPIVLIHGTGASLHTWNVWVDSLKNQHRIIRFDLPAYGLTGANPTGDYSMDYYADFVSKVLEQRNIKNCIIGGNSLGGSIAWKFAVKYPKKVNKLILVDAGGYAFKSKDQPIAFKLARVPILNLLFKYVTPRSVVEKSIENVYVDDKKISQELIDRYYELTLRAGNRQAFVDRMKNVGALSNGFEAIKNIKAPTLILWGEQDMLITTEVAELFHNDLENDTLVILPNLGHVPMEEDPQTSVKVLKEFLKKP